MPKLVNNYIQELKNGVYEVVEVQQCIDPYLEVGRAAIYMPFLDVEGEAVQDEKPVDMLSSGTILNETKGNDDNDK